MVKVELRGGEKELKFSNYSFMLAEKELGSSFIGQNLFSDLSFEKIVILTWAALLPSNKNLTIEEAAELVPFHSDESLSALTIALMKAYLVLKGEDPEILEKKRQEMEGGSNAGKSGKGSKRSQLSSLDSQ